MKRSTIDFFVGIFILIGIFSTAFLAFKVANLANVGSNSTSTYTLYANFTNIGSLKENAPIKVSGYTIGRVTNIYLDPKTYQAVVVMQIDKQYKFTDDSSAEILTTGLLGEQYVALQSGADNTFLGNNDHITVTSSAMVLEQLISKFKTNISK